MVDIPIWKGKACVKRRLIMITGSFLVYRILFNNCSFNNDGEKY